MAIYRACYIFKLLQCALLRLLTTSVDHCGAFWQVKQVTSAVTREQQLKEDLRKQLAAAAADSKRKVLLGFHEATLEVSRAGRR